MTATNRVLRNLDLNLLLLLESVARHGQLTAAAQELGMTQSAASQALARLRDALSDPLFVRTGHGMVPTERARALVSQVGPALREIASAVEEPNAFDPETSKRTFRLSFGALGELALLPGLVQSLVNQRSNVSLQSVPLAVPDALLAVRGGELDLMLDYEAPLDSSLRAQRVLLDEVVVVARRDHPRLNQHLSEDDYFREHHVIVAVDDRRRRAVEAVLGRGRHERVVAAEVAHHATVPALVMVSDALATVPRVLAELPVYRDHLKVMAPPWPLPKLSLFMVWHKAMEDDPGHNWLRGRLGSIGDRGAA